MYVIILSRSTDFVYRTALVLNLFPNFKLSKLVTLCESSLPIVLDLNPTNKPHVHCVQFNMNDIME